MSKKSRQILETIFIFFSCTLYQTNLTAQASHQLFDRIIMEYKGTPAKQAKVLMRKAAIWGNIVEKEAKLDSSFLDLLSNPMGITKSQVKIYLESNNISSLEVGGNIDSPISNIMHQGKRKYAKYFVIHDVSLPSFKSSFPENINDDSWPYNNPKNWNKKVTHTYLTRTGKLKTVTDFSMGLRATKFELKVLGVTSRGLFIHVELIQPRIYPPGNETNAPNAPKPGFTDIQYEKLALLYICASVRKGEWLVPGFHINIDEKLKSGHDDPQNFENEKFTQQILNTLTKIKVLDSHSE